MLLSTFLDFMDRGRIWTTSERWQIPEKILKLIQGMYREIKLISTNIQSRIVKIVDCFYILDVYWQQLEELTKMWKEG